jgi:hypothetical protein
LAFQSPPSRPDRSRRATLKSLTLLVPIVGVAACGGGSSDASAQGPSPSPGPGPSPTPPPPGPPSSGTVDVYAHFNSLHNHAAGQANASTNVGNWIARLVAQAPAGSKTYTLGAEFGFFNQWSLPPRSRVQHAEASSPHVDPFSSSWNRAQNVDVVEFVPDNFDGYGFDPAANTNMGASYQTVLLSLIDQWQANAPNPSRRYAVYAGWPQLNGYGAGSVGALSAPQIANWIGFGLGAYQTWMELLVSRLRAARPGLDIRLHNVSRSVLIAYRDSVVRTIPATTLFEDLAPHGRSSWYFLAAVADYIALYGEKPPANFNFNAAWGVSPVITANYQAIVDVIWSAR